MTGAPRLCALLALPALAACDTGPADAALSAEARMALAVLTTLNESAAEPVPENLLLRSAICISETARPEERVALATAAPGDAAAPGPVAITSAVAHRPDFDACLTG
ncbi:hypothetical protein [Pseudoroseicyclus sp. CXY001]|uniref:hypothetical protein n=1 Tax=Pseudoroseicyclus sp. CXY001 TaxID=3242492 RepID=UPI00358DCFFC